jgi:hypothetical protein
MNHRQGAALVAAASIIALALPCAALAIPHAQTPITDATRDTLLPMGTLLRISMNSTVSSAHAKAGDTFAFTIVDAVKIGDRVAIPAGTIGTGKVLRSTPAHGGRVDGSLHVEFDPVKALDGTMVDVDITSQSLAADENDRNGTAGSLAELADITLPGFFIIDFLRKGDDVTLSAGQPFHVAVTQDAFFPPESAAQQ